MTYAPKTWVTGETIEATDLNHMETGISDANPFYIVEFTVVNGEFTTNDTYENVHSQYEAGKILIFDVMGQKAFAYYKSNAYWADFVMGTFMGSSMTKIVLNSLSINSDDTVTKLSGFVDASSQ